MRRDRCGDAVVCIRRACALLLLLSLLLTTTAPARAAGDVWSFTGPGGGPVRTLATAPAAADVLYAGTEQGGVFKSTDGGISWGAINHGLPPRADVRAVVVDPAEPMTVYAGTRDAGVFRSTDAGAHWSGASSGLHSLGVNTLVTPATRTLFAGTHDGGMFKSIDGGTNWIAVNTGLADVEINVLTVDPAAATTLYAATQGAGVFKTTDGGDHWRAATTSPRYVNALAIDPSAPTTVYAASFSVAKSTDGGLTWADASNGIRYSNGTTGLQILSLVIDPISPTTLWASTLDAGVFESTDGAASWSPAGAGSPNTVFAFVTDSTGPRALHAGGYGVFTSTDRGASWNAAGLPLIAYVNAIEVDPAHSAAIYLTTFSEGVFKSTDGATTWSRANAGLPSPYVHDIVIDSAPAPTLLVSLDEGVFKSTDTGGSWHATDLGGPAGALAVAPTRPATFLATSLGTPSGADDVFRSSDAGTSWSPAGFASAFIGRFVVDPRNPATLYTASYHSYGVRNGGLFRSTDAGLRWGPTGLVTFDTVTPLAVDPESSNIIYAGYRGGLLKSTDGGTTWRAMNTGLPSGTVSALLFDPLDAHMLYASSGQLFTSTSAGADWSPFGSELPTSILALAIDPNTGDTLYAGTADGVFVLHRTDLDPTRPTPTPTPTADPRCPPEQIRVAPATGPPGATLTLSGQCYFLHSGRHADVFFDTTPVGAVIGDTAGIYMLALDVPADAQPGPHQLRVVGAQSVTFVVQPDNGSPTPTPTLGGVQCPSDNMTVVPNAGPVGTRVAVSGQCYYLHSGRGGDVYFDDTFVGRVSGDTPGNWSGGLLVPDDAAPGVHRVRLVVGGTVQSATFEVEGPAPTPSITPTTTRPTTPTILATGTLTPTRTPTGTATRTVGGMMSSSNAGSGGGCAVAADERTSVAQIILLCAPIVLFARRCPRMSNR